MSAAPDTSPPRPARPAAEIVADIEKERAGLNRSFSDLRDGLGEGVDAGRQRLTEAGRKAVVVAPFAAAAVAALAGLSFARRRR